MRLRHFTSLSMFTACLLASGAASATPILTIDGVSIPSGVSPGGLYLSSENSFENVVTAHGQLFSGVVKVADIVNNATATQTYSYGQNGAYLMGVFSGFVADTVVAPTASTPGTILFFGGQASYYVNNSDTFTINSGQATDFTNDSQGKLWLSLLPATIDAAGHTLAITIPANNGLGAFTNASATTFLDVVGGDAASAFNTNTFVNPFSHTGNNDILFQGTANSGSPSDFPISGTNALKANAVPEPVSISLFGGGLAAVGAFVRRRKSKKA